MVLHFIISLGLRMRLCNLFLQFIETPEFNPEAAKFQKIPYEILISTQNNQGTQVNDNVKNYKTQ